MERLLAPGTPAESAKPFRRYQAVRSHSRCRANQLHHRWLGRHHHPEEGQAHMRDANGDPKLGPSGNQNAGYVPWRYISQHPYVTYQADLPGYTKKSFDVEEMLVAGGIENVTNGFYSKS